MRPSPGSRAARASRELPGQRRPATEAEARALASTIRLRVLRACLDEPLSNAQIAERLGRNPATIPHHVRTRMATDFLAPAPQRRGTRAAREVPHPATGTSWLMEMGAPGPRKVLLATFLEEVAVVGERHLDSARLGLRLPPAELLEFRGRLQALPDQLARRPGTPGSQRWSVWVGIHPEEV